MPSADPGNTLSLFLARRRRPSPSTLVPAAPVCVCVHSAQMFGKRQDIRAHCEGGQRKNMHASVERIHRLHTERRTHTHGQADRRTRWKRERERVRGPTPSAGSCGALAPVQTHSLHSYAVGLNCYWVASESSWLCGAFLAFYSRASE